MPKDAPQYPPQPMLPHGWGGRVFGFLMERWASSNYRWVIEQLRAIRPQTYLEIGFGTGKMAELVAAELRPACICGIDPSDLMFDRATRRLKRFERSIEIDLRLGKNDDLPWAERSFDVIVASHSFQFWSDPIATLARLQKLIRANGKLLLVVRSHKRISRSTKAWIPNPITKGGKELDGLRAALSVAGFRVKRDVRLKSGSQGIVAECA